MRVNKIELARIIRCSIPTLNSWIAKYGDEFPVVAAGSHGRDWEFECDEVITFLASKSEEERRQAAERNVQIEQLSLPMGHNGGPLFDGDAAPPPLRPADLLAMAKLRRMEREEGYACGRLVVAHEVREAMQAGFVTWRKALHACVDRFVAEHAIPEALKRQLHADLNDCQRGFVNSMQQMAAKTREPELFD